MDRAKVWAWHLESPELKKNTMKRFTRLALFGAVALACASPVLADPSEGAASGGDSSESFTPPTPPPPFGQGVNEFIGSLPTNGGGVVVSYDFSGYTPPAGASINDLQVSWSDVVGLTGGAYDQYWMTNTSAPPQPKKQNFTALDSSPPSGNVGDGSTSSENYAFTVTQRTVSFAPRAVPEPAPLLLVGVALAAFGFSRRKTSNSK